MITSFLPDLGADAWNRTCIIFIYLALWPHYRTCGRSSLPCYSKNTGVVFPNVFFFQYIFVFFSEIMLGMFTMFSNLSTDMLLALQYIVIALLHDWNSIVVSLILLVLFLFYLGYLGLQFIHLHQLIYMYGMPNLTFINFMMIKYQQTLQLERIYFYIYFLLFIS